MAEELTLTVTGMTCGGCENAVRRALSRVDGVTDTLASHRDNRVVVTFDPAKTDRGAIARAIENAGYAVAGAA
jgi:copper chaperone CopZ